MKEKLYVQKNKICTYCGKEHLSVRDNENSFCSNNCKSAYRRKMKYDFIETICELCKEIFTYNKYNSRPKFCSQQCRSKANWQKRKSI